MAIYQKLQSNMNTYFMWLKQFVVRQDASRTTFWQSKNLDSIFFVACFMLIICWFFIPKWETNDDIAMSMVAHGYGIAARGAPTLIFSNVLWGYLVRALPEIHGVLGYSTATLAVLFSTACAAIYFLQRLGVPKFVSIIAVCIILFRATVFPQFTINAGLLTIASILGFWSYARSGSLVELALATLFAFLGYLVRSQEWVLVLVIATPLLPWKQLSKNYEFKIAMVVLILSIVTAFLCDHHIYSNDAWQRFYDINAARAPYTDFGAAEQLKNHPQILQQFGYSNNDIDLIRNFFFVDPKITDPKALRAMLATLGPISFLNDNIELGFESIKSLFIMEAKPMSFLALLLFLLRPKLSLLISFCIFLGTLFFFGLVGRGGVFRVYIPLVALCYLAGLVHLYAPTTKPSPYLDWRQILGACLSLAVFFFNYAAMKPAIKATKVTIHAAQKRMINFPSEVVVSWGSDIPLEFIFPVLSHDRQKRDLKLYSFGVFTHAPFSIAYHEQQNTRGFLDRLRSSKGILMVVAPDNIERLKTYCSEHYQAQLQDRPLQSSQLDNLRYIACIKKPS